MQLQTDILKYISDLHYLTQDMDEYSHEHLAEMACDAGIKWIQLRVKNKTHEEYLKIAEEVKKITDKYNCKLIINDNVQIAKDIDADGVHLGRTDMNALEARTILGDDKIIGGTANTKDDILQLENENVDYIGLGPFRFTSTKENLSPVLGLNKIIDLLGIQNKIPIIIIGGIMAEDVKQIVDTGAYGIAVSSAINMAQNRKEVVRIFMKEIEKCKN